jgi:hypothetical protein
MVPATCDAERKTDVVEDRHVRKEGQALEHHAEVAVARLPVRHALGADVDVPRGRRLQASDHVEGGGLAASRGADEHDELAVGDVEADAAHRLGRAEPLDDGVEPDAAHRRIIPKLNPFTRCFWIRKPKITTGMVTTVPMAACGP